MDYIVIASDLHSQNGAWADRPVRGDAYYAMDQIARYVARTAASVAAVVLCGDLLDKHVNPSGPVLMLRRFVRHLKDAGKPVYAISGQHELGEPQWLADDATMIHNTRVELPNGVSLAGLNYRTHAELGPALAALPEADVLVAHQVWGEFMGEHSNPQGWLRDVPAGFRAVWTGDLHQNRCDMIHRPTSGRLLALSPGATCRQAIDEPDEHYIMLYNTRKPPNDKAAYKRVKLRSRPKLEYQLDNEDVVGELLEKIVPDVIEATDTSMPEYVRAPLVRLHYDGTLAGVEHMVRTKLQKAGVVAHVFGRKTGMVFGDVPECEPDGPAVTLMTEVNETFPPTQYVLQHSLASQLVESSRKPDDVIDEWCANLSGIQ